MFNQRKQRGISMTGFLFAAAMAVFVALLGMKLGPAYMQFFTIKQILEDIGNSPDISTMTNAQIRDTFSKRAIVDYITDVRASDLQIGRQNGAPIVSVDYVFQTKLVGNVSILVEFSASSTGDGAP